MSRKNLRDIRLSRYLLQRDVAENCNISPGFYSLLENGLRDPSINTAVKVASSLGVSLDEFYDALRITKNPKYIPKGDMITDRQLKYLHILVEEKDIDPSYMKSYIMNTFNKDNSRHLTKKDASLLIELLKSYPGNNYI